MDKMSRMEALETSFQDTASSPVSFNNLNSLLSSNNKSKTKKGKKRKVKKSKKKL